MNLSIETIVTAVLSTIIGIAIFFIKKWMSDIEDKLEKTDTNAFKYSEKVQSKIENLDKSLTNAIHSTDTQIEVIKQQAQHINKKVDNLEKINDSIAGINGKIIQLESKVETLGKVIHIVREKK